MDQERITKGILSGIIDRYIVETAEDPDRSIRKLLDIAERTSDGPTQRICYQMMQQMAADRTSPYFDMLRHLVTHTAPQTIKQFGINLGHNAWTFGSGHLRHRSEECGMAIPWTVLIDRSAVPERIPFTEIEALISRGRKCDIYAWVLMVRDSLDEWEQYAGLFRLHSDCVFGLCLSPRALTGEILEEAAEIPNLMILLRTDDPDWRECAESLSRKGFLYAVFRNVSGAEDAEDILSGSWFEDVVPLHPLMAFTLIEDPLPDDTAGKLSSYMWDTRIAQSYPLVPVDLVSDFLIISRLVSHREVLFRVEPDGTVSEGKGSKFVSSPLRCGDLFQNTVNSQ